MVAAIVQGMGILVVDDDQMLGRAIGKVLRGHDVVVEHDGDRAIARIENGDWFELVLCDLNMPHRNGVEVLQRIRAFCGEDTPTLILMTGNDEIDQPTVADMLVTKPFSTDEICRLIAYTVEQKAQRCVATTMRMSTRQFAG